MLKRVLSIDIGLQKTKICEVEYGKKNPHIYNCITFDTPENAIEDGYIRDKETFTAVLKENLAIAKMKITDVVFTIASTKIANREIVIPMVKENRIQAVVDAGAQDYFPVDISEYTISYSILERINTEEEKKYKLLLLAAPNNMIKNYYSLAHMMNFTIVAIDYIGNSSFQVMKKQVGSGVNLSIQINEQATLINIIDNEILALQRNIPYGTSAAIEAVIDHKIFGIETEKEAINLLCQQELINEQFYLENDEVASALVDEVERNDTYWQLKGKKEITEALSYLVNNVIRVLDYYNSKFPEKKIQNVYITGQGAKFKGIEYLFHNEIGYEIKKINQLTSIILNKNTSWDNVDLSEYICAIGATMSPIGFLSKESIAKGEKKSSLYSMFIIFGCSSVVSLVLIIMSRLNLHSAKQEEKRLNERIEALLPAEDIYEEHARLLTEYEGVHEMYGLTYSNNEYLNPFITQIEEKLPSSMKVTSLTVNDLGISMNIVTNTKLSVAKMIMQLRDIDLISNITVDTIAEDENDYGITTVTFAVNCQYSYKLQLEDKEEE